MIRIRQIKIDIENDSNDKLINKISKKLNVNKSDILDYEIVKKSIDARNKNNICFVYEVDIIIKNEKEIIAKNKDIDIFITPDETFKLKITGNKKMNYRPIVVGSGPAGLISAYLLAENGYNPIIIERGEKVEDRVKTVNEFWGKGILNPSSNVQFGEGGAGTFSDGKLNTLVKDKEFFQKKVFEIFVENGAPKEIMYINNPHIGTDNLTTMVKNIRNKIISMGGEFKYNTCLTNIFIKDNRLSSIEVNNSKIIECDNLILAIGHSARDTFEMLYKNNIQMTSKPFAIGVRIQHSQNIINESQYGKYSKILPPASYKLTYKAKDKRGVYSFCMCPGGYVVNSSSEDKLLVINGMSNYKRNTENANSALVVTVDSKDYGEGILDGMNFQRKIESLAYKKGNGKIPIQLLKDFKNDKISKEIGSINPVMKGSYSFSNINEILPDFICNDLKEAIDYFNSKIKGYSSDDAVLAGVETRTSSPIRILRDENFNSNIKGIYPCGEGAGYSGGITTSAMDGIRVVKSIVKIYGGVK